MPDWINRKNQMKCNDKNDYIYEYYENYCQFKSFPFEKNDFIFM